MAKWDGFLSYTQRKSARGLAQFKSWRTGLSVEDAKRFGLQQPSAAVLRRNERKKNGGSNEPPSAID